MAVELTGVLLGGGLGLLGGLGGVFVGHLLSSKRDSVSRQVDGLRRIVAELNNHNRLALVFEQHINLGLRNLSVREFAQTALDLPGWKEATHELQERAWRFECMAFLPEALSDFEQLDQQISVIMDPYALEKENPAPEREHARKTAETLSLNIQRKVEARLKALGVVSR